MTVWHGVTCFQNIALSDIYSDHLMESADGMETKKGVLKCLEGVVEQKWN
jgi:hypothetical protein